MKSLTIFGQPPKLMTCLVEKRRTVAYLDGLSKRVNALPVPHSFVERTQQREAEYQTELLFQSLLERSFAYET